MYYNAANKGGLTAELGRAPSSSVWYDCPVNDLRQSFPGQDGIGQGGVVIGDDFCPAGSYAVSALGIGTLGPWAMWQGTSNSVALADGVEEGGVISMLGATTADTQFMLSSIASMFRFVGPTAAYTLSGGKFWMEARIALGSIAASQQGVFFGLCDHTSSQITSATKTIITTGENTLATTKNLIGFFNRTTTCPNDFSVVYQPAGGTAVYPTGLTTCVTTATGAAMSAYAASSPKGQGTGFVKLGMRYDPTPQNTAIPCTSATQLQTAGQLYRPYFTFYVNGLKLPTFLTNVDCQVSTFPNNCTYAPAFVYGYLAGSTPVYLDWLYFAQMSSF